MKSSRRLVAILGMAAIGALVIGLFLGPLRPIDESLGSPTPAPSVTAPAASLPLPDETQGSAATPGCRADQLAVVARGWDGATGSLVATALVVNVSNARCDLLGAPEVALLDATGASITAPATGGLSGDTLPLPISEVALATVIWSNWCSSPPAMPLALRLALPEGGGTLTAPIGTPGAENVVNLPRCDVSEAPSGASASSFRAPEPTIAGGQVEDCRADQLTAFTGEWGPAAGTNWTTLVVLNYGSALAEDCQLPDSPVAELRDADDLVIAQTVAPAGAGVIDLPGFRAAWTNLGLANWCAKPPKEPLSIDLVIGSDRVPVAARSQVVVPGCLGSPDTPGFFGYNTPLALP